MVRKATATPTKLLKDYYGFSTFREPQEAIINDLIQGQDLLVLMPTGGGKSLCYQIPAMIRDGVGIIVSPLIALMEDQVTALTLLGIRAAFYNSSLGSSEARSVLSKLHNNELDLLYIAPERLLSPTFLDRLKECTIALFAIDEAHCISQWGHDFRPEYRALGLLKTHCPHSPVIALTATADQQTRKDIIDKLHFQPKCYVASFNRPNIYYQVVSKHQPFQQLITFLHNESTQSGIIYCGTRASVERLALKLQEHGLKARAYHAGLSYQERRDVQTLFRHDTIDIVVATIAFGMGIDKPNVRFVVHYDLPKNIESYYQETGRAGRDGLPSKALLLYDPGDSGRLRAFIQDVSDEKQQRIEQHKLNHMLAFAEATHCRRQILLQYFDEETHEPCGHCDVCTNPPKLYDATLDAQKFLSCIYRVKQAYGLMHVIDVLRGSDNEKVKQQSHHLLSTYGIGKEQPAMYWKSVGWQLIHRGYCYQDLEQFNVLKLTAKAMPILKGEEVISLSLPQKQLTPKANSKQHTSSTSLNKTESPLFETLRRLRRQLAETENKPPFMIFSDNTLQDMIRKMPKSLHEMLDISGIGQHKLLQYGEKFLDVLIESENG